MGMMMNLRRSQMMVTDKDYIQFADPVVAQICAANWGDGIGITYKQAAAVTDMRAVFKNNTEITSFDELQFFTGITSLGTAEWSDWKAVFKGCSNLQSVTLPPSITSVNYQVFKGDSSLVYVNLEHLTRIWVGAFQDCSNLKIDIVTPYLTGELAANAFANSGVKRVLNLGSINKMTGGWGANEGCFYGCSELEVAIVPDTVTLIMEKVFANCTSLKAVVMKGNTPPTANGGIFSNTNNCPLYVPDEAVDAYKAGSRFSDYADRFYPLSQLPTDNPTLYNEIKDYL